MDLVGFRKITVLLIALCVVLSVLPFTAGAEDKASGTYQCDWFDESLFYPYEYNDGWFAESAYEYNHNLALLSLNVSMASFNSFNEADRDENIQKMLENCGFKVIPYGYDSEGYDTAAVEMAFKKTVVGNEKCTLVIAAVRSGNYGMEWGGNLHIGKGENHLGFDLAKETVINYINDFFAENPTEGRVKILIPGYSRGGSIANLIGAELDDGSYKNCLNKSDSIKNASISKEDIYVYTYESPQCTKKAADGEIYNNIFNIMNPNDYVPKFVMRDWGFKHYGVELYLPSAENTANYSAYYENVCQTFETLMDGTNKSADKCFYSKEDSRSVGATIDSLMSKLSENVLKSQDFYVENYEDGLIFIAGQYIGKKLNAGNAMKTFGIILAAVALGIIPTNMDTIKSDGFRSYLAGEIADSAEGRNLSDKQILGIIDCIIALLEFVKDNRSDVVALLNQVNTMANVHQPYVTLSWMRSIDGADIKKINEKTDKPLTVSFNKINLKYKATALITAEHDDAGAVTWKSSNEKIVTVDSDGFITAKGGGAATVTAELRSDSGELIDSEKIEVTVHMNAAEAFVCAVRNLFGKAEV